MRAAVLHRVGDMRTEAVPDPACETGGLVIKVKAATLCGTDLRIFHGKKTAGIRHPSVLGHEFAGEVADAGGNSGFRIGERVAVCPAFACGDCDMCKAGAENLCRNLVAMGYQIDGAFAEYVSIPARGVAYGHVLHLIDSMMFEEAALAEPLACVINGQEQAGVAAGDTVVVLGAGPIGLLHVKLARLSGARVLVSQRSAARREAALAAGADAVFDPGAGNIAERVIEATGGRGADVAICAIGDPALANDAIRMVRPRGRVNLFAGFSKGLQAEVDVNAIHYNEITVTGAFGLTRGQFSRALQLIASRAIDVRAMITHRFALSDMGDALDAAQQPTSLKVAILP